MIQPAIRPIEILLVEDNPADARMTVEALRAGKLSNSLHLARDGHEAMAFLRREGSFAGVARPDLVLLDLDLPGKDGREVLGEIRADPGLGDLHVVVLTTSDQHRDVVRSYDLHADSFFNKPIDVGQLTRLVADIDGLWLSIVELPG